MRKAGFSNLETENSSSSTTRCCVPTSPSGRGLLGPRCLQQVLQVLVETLCLSIRGPADVSSPVPAGAKYSVKWLSSVMQTQVVEVGEDSLQTTGGVAVVQPYSSGRPAGTAGHTSPRKDTWERRAPCVSGQELLGPPRMYQQLEELQHDLAVVQDVALLVTTLHGTYQVTLLGSTRAGRTLLLPRTRTSTSTNVSRL